MGIIEKMKLDGKKGFVTGAARGIGKSTATAFAEAGADVAIVDLDIAEAEKTAAELAEKTGRKVIAIRTDCTDPEQVDVMVEQVVRELGGLDFCHNNAGICINAPAEEMTYAQWSKVININLNGIFLTDIAAGKYMLAHGGGSIINTASMSGHIINKGSRQDMSRHMTAYASAKAGVIQLTKSIAVSYAADGIRCNSISPGMVLSGLHDHMDMEALERYVEECVPMNRFASLDEMMGIVVYLASDLSSYATGSDFVIDGGVTIW